MKLKELIDKKRDEAYVPAKIEPLLEDFQAWLEKTPFQDLGRCEVGSNAIGVWVEGDDGYLLRAAKVGYEPRALIPYLIQPIAFRAETHKQLVIEILPALPEVIDLVPKVKALKTSATKCGYRVTSEWPEVRRVHFVENGRKKQASMLIDPGDIVGDQAPTCEAGYPTLDAQLAMQKALVARYPRLQEYLKDAMPERAPETIIRGQARARF